MTAREYLQELQLKQGASNAYDAGLRARLTETMARAEPGYRKLLEDNLRKRSAFEARYADSLPTPYQSLHDYVRLVQAKDRIDPILQKVGKYRPLENLVVGSLETEPLNALGGYWPESDEYLIVFNRGLLLAFLAASNLVVCALSSQPDGRTEALDRIDENIVENLAPRFGQLLRSVSAGGVPPPEVTVPLLQFPEKEGRWTKLEDITMEFVFAHEYSHLLLGHRPPPASADLGDWGPEYEADSLAFELVNDVWWEASKGDEYALVFLSQGICLFFTVMCQLERYSAQMLGKYREVWSASKSHPPTLIRWLRTIEKIHSKMPQKLWDFVEPQMATIERCLALYYTSAVKQDVPSTSRAALEWHFQAAVFTTLRQYHVVPPYMFIALRCARAAIGSGSTLDVKAFASATIQADNDLEAAGARPLRDYRPPLAEIARELSERALSLSQMVGSRVVLEFVDRLADVFLLDTRTRYPLSA